jgi:hypothetical protein
MNSPVSRTWALDNVTKVHATHCDCDISIRAGVIRVGEGCKSHRADFLSRHKVRPGHKTGGKNSGRRLERSRARGYMWSAENESARISAANLYESLLSDEYKAQRSGIPHNHRKRASGVSAVPLGVAA